MFSSWTGAYHRLTPELPQDSLFSPPVMTSVLGSVAIQWGFQTYMFKSAKDSLGDDFVACTLNEEELEDPPPCSEQTVVYLISWMQYLYCCLCFSISKPFRKAMYTNPLFLVSVILMLAY
jgi:magnesium-transporting ATPase (P-type)